MDEKGRLMTDALPDIELDLSLDGPNAVIVGGAHKVVRLDKLVEIAPGLLQPAAASRLAELANYLLLGDDFSVITEPGDYAIAFRARLATEDPSLPWRPGVVRLCDFGVPDFDEIKAPELSNGRLVFFARDSFTGLPYRIELDPQATDLKAAELYQPLGLTPVES